MRKTLVSLLAATMLCIPLAACGQSQSTGGASSSQASSASAVESSQSSETHATSAQTNSTGTVSNAIAEDKDAIVAAYADKFTQETYTDARPDSP